MRREMRWGVVVVVCFLLLLLLLFAGRVFVQRHINKKKGKGTAVTAWWTYVYFSIPSHPHPHPPHHPPSAERENKFRACHKTVNKGLSSFGCVNFWLLCLRRSRKIVLLFVIALILRKKLHTDMPRCLVCQSICLIYIEREGETEREREQ